LILIATVSWIFFLFAIGFFVALYILRTVYIPTGRALKRLEAMSMSEKPCELTWMDKCKIFQLEVLWWAI